MFIYVDFPMETEGFEDIVKLYHPLKNLVKTLNESKYEQNLKKVKCV